MKQKEIQLQDQDLIYGTLVKNRRKSDVLQPINKPNCIQCGFTGDMKQQKKHGCASISWVVCLTCFTGILFWIPLVRDDCKDTVKLCPQCQKELDKEFADCF